MGIVFNIGPQKISSHESATVTITSICSLGITTEILNISTFYLLASSYMLCVFAKDIIDGFALLNESEHLKGIYDDSKAGG